MHRSKSPCSKQPSSRLVRRRTAGQSLHICGLAKTAQERPRSRPKSAQEPPKSAQEPPKSARERPRLAQEHPRAPKTAQERPKKTPKRPPGARIRAKPRVHGTVANAVRKYWSKGLSKPLHARSTKPHRLSGRYRGRQPHWISGGGDSGVGLTGDRLGIFWGRPWGSLGDSWGALGPL